MDTHIQVKNLNVYYGKQQALILTIIALVVSLGSRWLSARLNKYTVK